MEIRKTYKFKIDDKNIGYACGYVPIDVEILEERNVLFPKKDYLLERISDGEKFDCVWLQNGDVQENYIEVEIIEEETNE